MPFPKPQLKETPAYEVVEVSDAEMKQYAELIYSRTGIHVHPRKKTLLSNRLRRRLRVTGIKGFDSYYLHLKKLNEHHPEWDQFLQQITTHETFLFRDAAQWKWFSESYLPAISKEARAGRRKRTLRIWSAACSNGDEAYTIACCIASCLPHYKQWQIEIFGSDIGVGAVESASNPTFKMHSMKKVSESYRKAYFKKDPKEDVWEPRSELKRMTSFRQHNLMDRLSESPFDLVFLKNVLIYFDAESKQKVMQNIDSKIRPGGYLISGPTEGISDFVSAYTRIQPWLHRQGDGLTRGNAASENAIKERSVR